ncbi:hypothetical protein Q4Q39_10410 [Flavivirga amylovorans]|uniref:DUF3575 domain-containing protein n=1 Tax=Flavivirga amylovorans TaxID=870486 RepID=A0ABT8X1I7_9FLAO|nr:hypothetical protein [Flavivirga amylovorans]MDO5987812.1 hypothetical protein [Flavivirga amylovorans]
MTKVVFASLLVMSSYFGFSQNTTDASVEKSVFGIQVGLIGIWAHNELKLSNQVVLRSEIGLAGVNTANIEPLLALEPRWYYNINKRANKGKRIDGNSGNYISFRTSYRFFDSSEADKNEQNYLFFTPTWGIRRNIGNHFNYEAGIGVGLGFFNNNEKKVGYTSYLNLKIGYRF